jgi:hypothetical protein
MVCERNGEREKGYDSDKGREERGWGKVTVCI